MYQYKDQATSAMWVKSHLLGKISKSKFESCIRLYTQNNSAPLGGTFEDLLRKFVSFKSDELKLLYMKTFCTFVTFSLRMTSNFCKIKWKNTVEQDRPTGDNTVPALCVLGN